MRHSIVFETKGDFKNTERFLKAIQNGKIRSEIQSVLEEYGSKGVSELSSNTPVRSGASASSWSYAVVFENSTIRLEWRNNRMASDGRSPLVVLIIHGHGTRTGGYVPPNDFVTPVISSICEEASEAVWRVVKAS